MNIYSKLAIIQTKLVAPKGQFNDFGKYSYRSCEDILCALKPLCEEVNAMVYMNNELENIGDRNYVKATVTFVDLESGETLSVSAHAREEETKKGMDGSQITGASSSYARKYALAGMFAIDNEKDSDATNKGDETISEKDAMLLEKCLTNANVNIEKLLAQYKVNSLKELRSSQYSAILQKLNKESK